MIPIAAMIFAGNALMTGYLSSLPVPTKLQLVHKMEQEKGEVDFALLGAFIDDPDDQVCAAASAAFEIRTRRCIDELLALADNVKADDLEHLRNRLRDFQVQSTSHPMREYTSRIARDGLSESPQVRRDLICDLSSQFDSEDGDAGFQECGNGPQKSRSYAQPAFMRACELNPSIVIDLLRDPDVHFKAKLLESQQDNISTALLSQAASLVQSPSAAVRVEAVVMLGKQTGVQFEKILIQAATDPNEVVRSCAAQGLKDRDGACVTALLKMCTDADSNVRWTAVGALPAESSSPIRAKLREMLASSNPEIRSLACDAIGSRHEQDLLPDLLKRLKDDDSSVVKSAQSALDGFNGPP